MGQSQCDQINEMADQYTTLRVSPSASQAEIRSAYLRLASKYHPDVNGNDSVAAEEFKQLLDAYERLRDQRRQSVICPSTSSTEIRKRCRSHLATGYVRSSRVDRPGLIASGGAFVCGLLLGVLGVFIIQLNSHHQSGDVLSPITTTSPAVLSFAEVLSLDAESGAPDEPTASVPETTLLELPWNGVVPPVDRQPEGNAPDRMTGEIENSLKSVMPSDELFTAELQQFTLANVTDDVASTARSDVSVTAAYDGYELQHPTAVSMSFVDRTHAGSQTAYRASTTPPAFLGSGAAVRTYQYDVRKNLAAQRRQPLLEATNRIRSAFSSFHSGTKTHTTGLNGTEWRFAHRPVYNRFEENSPDYSASTFTNDGVGRQPYTPRGYSTPTQPHAAHAAGHNNWTQTIAQRTFSSTHHSDMLHKSTASFYSYTHRTWMDTMTMNVGRYVNRHPSAHWLVYR